MGYPSFNSAGGVATDAAGNVYVPDTNNHTIRKVSPAGEASTLAGSALLYGYVDGVGAQARFGYCILIIPPIDCAPCYLRQCEKSPSCQDLIDLRTVMPEQINILIDAIKSCL